ncbi:hypothetical protein PG984_015569 [Apiospora sp. TS-2023a]
MPNSFDSVSVNHHSPNDEVDDDIDKIRPWTRSVDTPPPAPPPPLRTSRPGGSATVQDVPDEDAPGRANRDRDGKYDKQPKASERQRNLIVTGEPSGRSVRYPITGNPNIAIRSVGAPNNQAQHTWSEHQEWESSDDANDAQAKTPRIAPSRRAPPADNSGQQAEEDWRVGPTERRAVHQPQPTRFGGREGDELYAGRRYDNPDPGYRDTPSKPLGEMARYYNYYNRDPNPFPGPDDYTKLPYFGGPPQFAPSMGPYPNQALTYTQPMGYAQPGSYQPPQYPFNYGYPPPQPFSAYNAPPPQPPWTQPDPPPAPAPPVRYHTHSSRDDMGSEMKKILKELEDNKKKLADQQDLILKFKSKDKESEILYKAKKTEARAQKKEEQARSELEAAALKRLEDEKQELARREYQEKLTKAANEAREQLEQKLREEERLRRAEEQRLLGLEADLRRRIQAEMEEEQERKRREVEKRMYLEMEIREKILAERREQEEMTLREELRKQHIEKRLEHEFEMKRRRADELQQYKENIEAKVRMEASQIIGAEKRKMDLEKLKLELQHDQDRVIRDTMNPPPDEPTGSFHRASRNVHDYLDPDQRTVASDGVRHNYTHSLAGERSLWDGTNSDITSNSSRSSHPHRPPQMMTPQTTDRSISLPSGASISAQAGSSRPVSQQTVIGRPESVRHHLYNHSRNPFDTQHYGHVGSQQHLHQPTPMHHSNSFGILQEMAVPMASPSGLSSNINIPNPLPRSRTIQPGSDGKKFPITKSIAHR